MSPTGEDSREMKRGDGSRGGKEGEEIPIEQREKSSNAHKYEYLACLPSPAN